MTNTTTDAAEARARSMEAAWRALSEPLSWMHDNQALKAYWGWNLASIANDLIDRAYPGLRNGTASLATAEAASGAGERELRADIARLFDAYGNASCGECGTPLFDVDEMDTDEAETVALCAGHVRDGAPIYAYRLASVPPATDPAMGLDPVTVGRCVAMCEQLANGCRAELKDPANDARTISILDGYIGACTTLARNIAALAAAPTIPATGEAGALAKMTALDEEIEAQHPGWMTGEATIPATGEAIPAGMKPWHGGDAAPNDLDLSGRVLREDGQTEVGRDVTIQQWKRPVPRCKWNIIAYTPKATIPATGHAATEGEGA